MKTYEFTALDAFGSEVRATAVARNEAELDRELEAQSLTLLRANVASASMNPARRKLKQHDLIAMTTQLAAVTGAGVPLVEGLEGIGQRMQQESDRELVIEMVAALRQGDRLSTILERYPRAFPDVYRASVAAGEASGALDAVLVRLAKNIEWVRATKATASQALIYPAMLIFAICGLIVLLLYHVLPKILTLFPGGRDSLPAQTRVVLGLSDFLRGNIVWLALGGAVLVTGFLWAIRQPKGRIILHGALLRVPRLGTVLRQIATSRFAGTASILQSAGCDVFTVLGVSGSTCGNAALEAAFIRATERVRHGSTIAEALEKEPEVDRLLVQMVSVGEKTGELDNCLVRVVSFYDDEVPRTVKRFLTLLEPLLLIVSGVVVGYILLAALLPIFDLYDNMG